MKRSIRLRLLLAVGAMAVRPDAVTAATLPFTSTLTLHFVPEPGTLAMLATDIGGLVLFGRAPADRGRR